MLVRLTVVMHHIRKWAPWGTAHITPGTLQRDESGRHGVSGRPDTPIKTHVACQTSESGGRVGPG